MKAGCAHFGVCGGCTWQHLSYREQLRRKTALVTRLVGAAVPGAPAAQPTVPGTSMEHPWGYRKKVHFVFGNDRGRLVMGHYAAGSRRVIPVSECPVHDEQGNDLAFSLRDAFARANVAAAPQGTLKGVAIRVGHGTREVMATLVVSQPSDTRLRSATTRFIEAPADADAPAPAFHLNIHPRGDASIFGRQTRRIRGPERMREEVAGVSFLLSPTAFFQTNVAAADTLVGLVRDAVPAAGAAFARASAPRRVLDLYAGVGLFALPLARDGHAVTAVDENRAAVADGEASRALNRIPPGRCRFVARRVEDGIAGAFDVVVLDPPRDGCSPAVIEAVFGAMNPPAAIYVSCNPEALARDLAAIVPHGYRIESLQPVDMFPHTEHVETVVRLARSRPA